MKNLTPIFTSTIRNSVLLLLAAWLHIDCLCAQNPNIVKGYYISSKGDSHAGLINISKINDNILKFKASGEKQWIKLGPQDVKEATGEQGVYIISQEVRLADTMEQIFLKKLAGGEYSLYEGDTKKWGTVFYINAQENNSMTKVNKLGYKAQLEVLLGKCADQTKVKNVQYNSTSLVRYLSQVNKCIRPDSIPLIFRPPVKPKFGIGVSAFYYTINPSVRDGYYFLGDYHRVNRISGGLSAKIKISRALSVFAGLNFIDKRITTDTLLRRFVYVKQEPGHLASSTYDYYKYAMDLNFKYLEIPLGMTYSPLPYSKWSPVFSFGFALQRPAVSKVENDWGYPTCPPGQICTLPPGEVGHISPTTVEVSKKQLINFFGGIGCKKVFAEHEVEMMLEYFNQRELAVVGINKIEPSQQQVIMKTPRLQLSIHYHFFFKNNR